MSEFDLIKLVRNGERFWAEPLSDSTAKVRNILIRGGCSLDDIVVFDEDHNVTAVIVNVNRTVVLSYAFSPSGNDAKNKADKVAHFLNQNTDYPYGIQVPGMICIAVPVGVPIETVREELENCPVELKIESL